MINDKIKTLDELQALRPLWTEQKLKVGFTSGVFDLLHAGHAEYLETAKSHCDLLIVAVNSDTSVRQNKGPSRPIVSQEARATLIAALASVDYVFIFEETTNRNNIDKLRPDFYIKAGDYSPEQLGSGPFVKSYGGEIIIVPFKAGFSSSSIIEKIQKQSVTISLKHDVPQDQKAIFLDRDGTIIEHIEYLHEPERVREIEGSFAALKQLRELGFKIIIVTNQPGIGFGYFDKEDFFKVNKEFLRLANNAGVLIDKIYFCPHTAAEKCECRKPNTAFLKRAVSELGIDLSKSFMIGDSASDIQFGKNGALKTVLVECDPPIDPTCCTPDFIAKDLTEAARWIKEQSQNISE
ncbi:MAG: HAD-IIIA family hydrolase [Bdellovibrionota bacterium]|jgi:rfaE bifunctional protein nucleotidyltransferase chain/domain